MDTPSGAPLVRKPPMILVVDDFDDAREMYEEYLTFRQYRVVVASNGREAVEQARAHRPDVILLDLRMPILTGLETLRLLRADASFANTPIAALTAHALDEEREAALAQGFDAFLAKPCLPDELASAIEGLLSRARPA
jgi:two-component system, cell cycle response regulator DivK